MTDILTRLLSGTALLFLVLLLAILYDGVDRLVHARMQRRLGPPILQPFYDVMKLFRKEAVVVNHAETFLVVMFLLFMKKNCKRYPLIKILLLNFAELNIG